MSLWFAYTTFFFWGVMLASMGYSGLADNKEKASGISVLTFLGGIYMCMAVVFHIITGGA